MRALAFQFVKVILPLAAQLDAEGDRAKLQSLYLAATRVVLAVFVPFAAVVIVLARPILVAWVGPAYGDAAILVVILTLASLLDICQWPGEQVLQGMGRHHPLAVMALADGVTNVALSIVLVQHLGVVGVALGTLAPMTVETLGLVMPYVWRVIGVAPSQVLTRAVAPVILPAIPAVVVLVVFSTILGTASAPITIILACVCVTTYVAAYLRFGASAAERQTYRGAVSGTLRFAEARLRRP